VRVLLNLTLLKEKLKFSTLLGAKISDKQITIEIFLFADVIEDVFDFSLDN
jgi:hypothetical protein